MFTFYRQLILFFRLLSSLLAVIALFFPLQLFGEEQVVGSPQPPSDRLYLIDTPRDYLSDKFVGLATSIDRFFGDDRNFQEGNKSVFQLDLTRVSGFGGNDKFELSGRAKVRLPATESRLHLLLETDPEKNLTPESKDQAAANRKAVTPVSRVASTGSTVATPKSLAAAVRYEKKEESPLHYSTDAGVQFHGITSDPNPFARARASYTLPVNQWRLKASETLFWFYSIGAGETTQFDMEHLISDPLLFRATSTATWLFETQNYDLRQDLSFYHTLSKRTALLYQASAIGITNPHLQATDYVISMVYRYRVHREWIFLEISPQLHFPKVNHYQFSPSLNLRLEMLFDDS